jgi:hypothetical protein
MNDWMPWKDSDAGVNMAYSGPPEGGGEFEKGLSKLKKITEKEK